MVFLLARFSVFQETSLDQTDGSMRVATLRVVPSFRGRLTIVKLVRLMCKTSKLICFIHSEISGTAGPVHGWFEVHEISTLSVHRQGDLKVDELVA